MNGMDYLSQGIILFVLASPVVGVCIILIIEHERRLNRRDPPK